MAHKHKHLMEILAHQILNGVETPSRLWEYKWKDAKEWTDCINQLPEFHEDYEYRLKPKFIMINGYKVPEPERVAPQLNTAYYAPCHFLESGYNKYYWTNMPFDKLSLKNGVVHLTPEAAIMHSKAIYSFTRVQS